MREVVIDFAKIVNIEDFYVQLKEETSLPSYFGDNLDALYDSFSGGVEMPLKVDFVNMEFKQLEYFKGLLNTMKDLSQEVEGFTFFYKTKRPEI